MNDTAPKVLTDDEWIARKVNQSHKSLTFSLMSECPIDLALQLLSKVD